MLYPAAAAAAYPHHHAHPGPEQMTSSHMPPYQPWAYPPLLHQYHHGCCNHPPYYYYYYYGAPTSLSFQPHYTHCPPPPPPPPFHGVYPDAYSVPPQHYYSVEHPWYNYDKNHNHHCPRCEDEKRPRESHVDHKPSDSQLPFLLKDHPLMWIPTESKANDSHAPVSPKHLEPTKGSGNGEDEQQGKQFPFQIFWLPSQVGKENNLDLGLSEEDDKKTKNNEEEGSGCEGECEPSSKRSAQKLSTNEQTSCKHAVQKVIPVKQASGNEEKNLKSMMNSNSVENGNGASAKTSKLPPVCLRIDPLPKKKKSSSPSPSPTGGKERNTPKSSQQQQVLKEEEQSEKGYIKTIDHANKADVPRDESDKGKVEKKKKNMSEHEAALIIQSVYRGFEVRKSQPLKKLRQISQVKKQVFDLRQDLETSSSCIDAKKQVIIGETIMSLLLKLDTIQGLHPFVREVRKSVAKELVGLQENLDSVKSSDGSPQRPEDDDAAAIMQQGKLDHEQKGAVESTDDAEAPKQLEKSTEDNDQESVICENHATVLQEGTGEKIDQAPPEAECDVESHQGFNTVGEGSQLPTESLGLCEVEATESGGNIIGEPQLQGSHEDQAPTGCDDEALALLHRKESHQGCNTAGASQLESRKDKSDEEEEASIKCDRTSEAALGLLCENHDVEDGGVEGDDMKPEENTNKEMPPVESEDDLVKVESSMMLQQHDVCDVKESGDDISISMVSEAANEEEGVMEEENQKLRAAVKELMKAGNEQLDVIKELTARLEDLEKKLHSKNNKKKKKVKVSKCRRSRDVPPV